MTKAAIEPNGVLQTWVQDYLATGWALCPIPAGQKAPKLKGWNRRENAILRRGQAGLITDNVGLLHAFSGTVSIDIDDYQLAEPFLMSRGINLEALLGAPEAVLIDSGRPNRCKLLYRHSDPLQYRKMATYGLELRCADSKGGSVQDVLPPSIHPNGNPYIWAGHGHFSNLPALPQDLLDLWLSAPEVTPLPNTIKEGSRNDALTRIAGTLRNQGKEEKAVLEALQEINDIQCKPPLPDHELVRISRSISRYEPGDEIDDMGEIGDSAPLIDPGDYWVIYQRHRIYRDFHGWGPKIAVWFVIAEGEYQGLTLRVFYRIVVEGRKWHCEDNHRLTKEFSRLFPGVRKDRISAAMLKGHTVLARVGPSRNGEYSVIRKLLELKK